MEELIVQVQRAYVEFEPRKIDFAFLTLQCCIDDSLANHGANDYTIRHMGKESMVRAGTLPVSIVPSATALEVFDMLERGRELVVNDDNIVENNPRGRDAAVVQMIR